MNGCVMWWSGNVKDMVGVVELIIHSVYGQLMLVFI
jgi:hypothetical protein